MVAFSRFDTRHYPALPVRDGDEAWTETYEATALDLMDLRLLGRLRTLDWPNVRRALDLACGAGRGGAWQKAQGVSQGAGVDFTSGMLARAKDRGVTDAGWRAMSRPSTSRAAATIWVTMLLADEHLADLAPVYREAARRAAPSGRFVLVGFHPWFLMSGAPTHVDRGPGGPVAIESHVHLFADLGRAAP